MSNLDFGFLQKPQPPLEAPDRKETVSKWWFQDAEGTFECYYCHRRWREDHKPFSQRIYYTAGTGTCYVGIKIISARIDFITKKREIDYYKFEVSCVYCTPSEKSKELIQTRKNELQKIQDELFYQAKTKKRAKKGEEDNLPY